ncbi:MAG: translation elongation factor-like protein [Chloroflexi bacterium]|nr:translation elongation factor-like protein [Chloroflexota bacterium]
MPEVEIGRVTAFFARPMVAGVELTESLAIGDQVHIHGHTTDIHMPVESMQVNNVPVREVEPGQAVGLKVPDRVRRGDVVYKVTA